MLSSRFIFSRTARDEKRVAMSDAKIMIHSSMLRILMRLINIPRSITRWLDFLNRGIFVARGTVIQSGVKIGRRTRINAPSHLGPCEIGSYCAIGGRLIVRSSNHDIDFLNMQYFAQHKFLKSKVSVTHTDKQNVIIGHGVWIGDSVIVLPGVKIGNGAVIGAGSVVTKDIPDYAVAVGNPARTIKYRFSPAVCHQLSLVYWWEWDDKKLSENLWLFEKPISRFEISELASVLATDSLKLESTYP